MKTIIFFISCGIFLVSCSDNNLNLSNIISKDLFLNELKGNVKECKISETHFNNGNTFTLSEVISFNKKGHIINKLIKTPYESSNYMYENHYTGELRDSTVIFDSKKNTIQKKYYSYNIENKKTSIINIDFENQFKDSIKIKYSNNTIYLISPRLNKEMSFDNESSLIKVENKVNNQSDVLTFSNDKYKSEKVTNGFKEISSYTYDEEGNWVTKNTVFNVKTENKIRSARIISYY